MWRSLSVTINFGYAIFFLISYNNLRCELTLHDFREVNDPIECVDYISLLWRPRASAPFYLCLKGKAVTP
jgi:hypothetical protein